MDERALREILDRQAGTICRRQVLELGGTDAEVRRLVRKRIWARVYDGIYVNHTGPLSWSSRAWAAVLFYWPAALTHESAVYLSGDVIQVAIPKERTATRLSRIRVHRLTHLDERVQWNASPPRVRFEDALLLLCERAATRTDALALVADACQRRRTTPSRVLTSLKARPKMRYRVWLLEVLADIDQGVRSVLEAAYLRKVERAHGLPRGSRQPTERTQDGVVYRDVRYDRHKLIVELDGRLGHELAADRWNDMDRDLLVAGQEVMTLRLGWRHAEDQPCRTAGRLALVFRTRGWDGSPVACGAECALSVGSQSHTG